MRTAIIAAVLAFGWGFGVAAQEAEKPHNMAGCLQKGKEAKTFALTDDKGTKTVELVESTVNLSPHLGHKIEITGTTDSAREKKEEKDKQEGKKVDHYMKVSAVKMISAACP